MAGRGVITSWLLGALSLIALAFFVALEPWRGPDDGELHVVGFAPMERPLARNETLTLSFDRPLHPETPLEALIRVRDAAGRRIPIRIEGLGESVLLRPRDGLGWPGDTEIAAIVSPGIAVPFRGRDLSVLKKKVSKRFRVGSDYLDYGRELELALATPTTLVSVPRGASFRVTSNLPLDATSLSADHPVATVIVGEPGARRVLTPEVALADDGRTLQISPWRSPDEFSPGIPHRLFVWAGRLRSVTGRALERDLVIDFSSSKERALEGQIDVSFALRDLELDSLPSGIDARGYARPLASRFASIEMGISVEQRLESMVLELPFAPYPRRLQILVPGDVLGEEPGVVTGFSFFAGPDPLDVDTVLHRDLILPRVVFRIGEFRSGGETLDLGPIPDGNFDRVHGPHETVAQGSREGELVLRRRLRPRGAHGDWIEIEFDQPYTYRGGNRPLVLEIINDAGAFALDGAPLPAAWPGPVWVSSDSLNANPTQQGFSLVSDARLGEDDLRISKRSVFATKIHIQRYQDLVTRWYEAEVEQPLWFRIPAAGQVDAEGTEGRDFEFDFQGLDGDGQLTTWGRLEYLNGCRRIRARLRFLPGLDRRTVEAVVRRVRLKYRDGR